MKWLLFPILSLAISSASFAQGNGGERGGGDLVVGEFRNVESEVIKKITAWNQKGLLKISDSDLERIKITSNTAEVIARPKACIHYVDETTLENCKSPGDERQVVNEYRKSPIRFIVSWTRWPEYDHLPLKRETLVLHELIEATLSKGPLQMKDKKFEETYAILLAAQQDWEQFKSDTREWIKDFYQQEQMWKLIDLSNVKSYLQGKEESKEYQDCMATKGMNQRQSEIPHLKCDEIGAQIVRGIGGNILERIQTQSNRIVAELTHQVTECQTWKNNASRERANWATDRVGFYLGTRNRLMQNLNASFDKNEIKASLNQVCPTTTDLAADIECILTKGPDALEATIMNHVQVFLNAIKQDYEDSELRVSAQIDPV